MLTAGVIGGKPIKCEPMNKKTPKLEDSIDDMFQKMSARHRGTVQDKAEPSPERDGQSGGLRNRFKDSEDGIPREMASDPDGLSEDRVSGSPGCVQDQTVLAPDRDWPSYSQRLQQTDPVLGKRKGWPRFSQVFMVSALDGDGCDDIKVCPPGDVYQLLHNELSSVPWQYLTALLELCDLPVRCVYAFAFIACHLGTAGRCLYINSEVVFKVLKILMQVLAMMTY